MKELLRKSPHQHSEVVAVQDDQVDALLVTGNYELVSAKTKFDKTDSKVDEPKSKLHK